MPRDLRQAFAFLVGFWIALVVFGHSRRLAPGALPQTARRPSPTRSTPQ